MAKQTPKQEAKNTKGYKYIPSIRLFVSDYSKPRGSWFEAHESLQKEDARMLTLSEHLKFLYQVLMNKNNPEYRVLFNDLFEPKDTQEQTTAEHIDAMFTFKDGLWQIHQNHKIVSGKIVSYEAKGIPKYLPRNAFVDIEDLIKKQLPTEHSSHSKSYIAGVTASYSPPKNGAVARWIVTDRLARLACEGNPNNSDSRFLVREARASLPKSQNP